jgi:glutamyl-tRNA reductase
MVFVVCGLNHKTAPLEVREKFALSTAAQDRLLSRIAGSSFAVQEAVILSTCNRTEMYCETHDPEGILSWLVKEQNIPEQMFLPYFYSYQGYQGIRHILRVASGLDSMMIGEPQILGQMKQAYQQACKAGSIQGTLRSVFHYIFNASKRIRSQSGIGNNPVSIAFAAAQLIGKFFADFTNLSIFLIGSGEISSLVAKYLHKQGVHRFFIASRSQENAQLLAANLSGCAISITEIPQYLAQADVIVSATTCPLPFISKELVQQALSQRENRPMFLLDLAVPRDIESDVNELPEVQLYNIDDLHRMTEKGMDERRQAAILAEQFIDVEVENYIRGHRTLQAKEVICDYRNQMQELAQLELQRAIQKLSSGQCQYQVLSEFSERLVNKLVHSPTLGLRQAAWDDRKELLDLAQYLFSSANHSTV